MTHTDITLFFILFILINFFFYNKLYTRVFIFLIQNLLIIREENVDVKHMNVM